MNHDEQVEEARRRVFSVLGDKPTGVTLRELLGAVGCQCGAPRIEAVSAAVSSALTNEELELTSDRIVRIPK